MVSAHSSVHEEQKPLVMDQYSATEEARNALLLSASKSREEGLRASSGWSQNAVLLVFHLSHPHGVFSQIDGGQTVKLL